MNKSSSLSGRDLVEAEIFRKRLENLTTEMAITLARTSGSIHVTESKDFSTALFGPGGEQMGFSGWVSFHIASSLLGVAAVRESHPVEDVRPGDIFCCNDPYTSGAMHQGDVGIVMPFFHDGELVGWGFVNEHVADVGGSAIGGMAPEARDVFSESLRFPGTRIGRDYRIDPDWRRFIEAGVRVPGPVLNDIQSMVAGNNVGQEKLGKIIDRYGLERFRRLSEVSQNLTEEAMRDRIGRLPNGVFVSDDWCEYDGHGEDLLLDLRCELTVGDDELTFAFSSQTAQIDAFVNGAKPAVWGQCMTSVLCQLAFDIPANAGLWRPINIDVGPAGTVVNPLPPAPVSNAHMEVGMRIAKLAVDVISQACALSDDDVLRSRVAGQPQDGVPVALLFGPDQYGQPNVTVFQDAAVGVGGGAQTAGDGLDCYGAHCMLGCGMPDIEIQERAEPKLFLYRRLNPSSSGAGWSRGGLGIEAAAVIRGSSQLAGVGLSSVERVPPRGFGGGYPASASSYYVLRGTDVLAAIEGGRLPGGEDDAAGTRFQPPSKTAELVLNEGDVLVFHGGGGGGLGDPLHRAPESVARDVNDGYLTTAIAVDLYGVVIRDGHADETATAMARADIRAERLGGTVPERTAAAPPALGIPMVRNAEGVACAACDTHLAGASDDWREACTMRTRCVTEAFSDLGMDVRARPPGAVQVLMREVSCPGCGSALSVDILLETESTAAAAAPAEAAAVA